MVTAKVLISCWYTCLHGVVQILGISKRPSVQYWMQSCKMVNGFWYYRALESVSIASALSTALIIYSCQIRVHQRWQSKLQLPTARKKEWRPATAGNSPHAFTCQHCDTHYFSKPRTRSLPIVGWLLVRRATSSATDSCRKVTNDYVVQM